ncbi:MAG: 3-isopropylmalate dehydratase [Candidatus Lokiarchaeota archaeon]|nr:3-isopropylmalate dehydratase [Candidatus Lokiarchaeota archaeon]
MDLIKGWIYILGDDINTDDIVPSYTLTMRDPNEIAKHTLRFIDPKFISKVNVETIILAGENFGTGSSREEAVNVFKILGIKAIIAKSFARIYFRNLINNGIPPITMPWEARNFSTNDKVEISLHKGELLNKSKNVKLLFQKLPDFIIAILKDGGILNQLKNKIKKGDLL